MLIQTTFIVVGSIVTMLIVFLTVNLVQTRIVNFEDIPTFTYLQINKNLYGHVNELYTDINIFASKKVRFKIRRLYDLPDEQLVKYINESIKERYGHRDWKIDSSIVKVTNSLYMYNLEINF